MHKCMRRFAIDCCYLLLFLRTLMLLLSCVTKLHRKMSSTTPERQSQRLNSAPKKSNGPDSATKKTAKQPKTKTTAVTHFYTGSILSYTEPETERSGYGIVGTWRRNQKVYDFLQGCLTHPDSNNFKL